MEVLWLVGDYPAYYPRNRTVTRAFARILTALGVRWGVLGNKERTIGDCDRLFGEEGLFESLVEYNRNLLDGHHFEKIITLDPHSYRSLERFYPKFRAKYPVEHYTTFLADRMDQLKGLLTKPVEATVMYRDNCCAWAAVTTVRSAAGPLGGDPRREAGRDGASPRELALLRRRPGPKCRRWLTMPNLASYRVAKISSRRPSRSAPARAGRCHYRSVN